MFSITKKKRFKFFIKCKKEWKYYILIGFSINIKQLLVIVQKYYDFCPYISIQFTIKFISWE